MRSVLQALGPKANSLHDVLPDPRLSLGIGGGVVADLPGPHFPLMWREGVESPALGRRAVGDREANGPMQGCGRDTPPGRAPKIAQLGGGGHGSCRWVSAALWWPGRLPSGSALGIETTGVEGAGKGPRGLVPPAGLQVGEDGPLGGVSMEGSSPDGPGPWPSLSPLHPGTQGLRGTHTAQGAHEGHRTGGLVPGT